MWKNLLLILAIAAMLLIPAGAIAEEEITEDLEGDPGVTPDSPLWGIDVALDKLSYLLTIGPEARARKGLAIAHERLLEIKAMADEGNDEAMEDAEEEHNEILGDVQEDIEDLNGEDTNDSEEKITGIERGMANHLAAIAKVRARIAENTNIPNATRAKLELKFANSEAKAEELIVKIITKKEQIRIKHEEKLKGGDEDEEKISDIVCSLEEPCTDGLECFDFPGIGLRCAQLDPCSYY